MSSAPTSTSPPTAHECPGTHGRSPVAHALTRAIGWYQVAHQDRPSPCRFVPSCSTYALEAVSAHGVIRGAALSVRRLLRCHPWGGHGFDPVPPSAHERVDQRV